MTMITPSYLGETIEYSSLHACRSTLEDPTRNATDQRVRVPPGKVLSKMTERGISLRNWAAEPAAFRRVRGDRCDRRPRRAGTSSPIGRCRRQVGATRTPQALCATIPRQSRPHGNETASAGHRHPGRIPSGRARAVGACPPLGLDRACHADPRRLLVCVLPRLRQDRLAGSRVEKITAGSACLLCPIFPKSAIWLLFVFR